MKKKKINKNSIKKKHKPYPESKLAGIDETYSYDQVWHTLDGQRIPIINLRDSHIENILGHLLKHNRMDSYKIILAEKEHRQKAKLIKKSKIGKLLYERK